MDIRVTESSTFNLKYTNLLYNLEGEVVTDFEYDEMSKFEKREFNSHAFKRDILVYFPIYDFCYWLEVGEYELIKIL